MAAKDSNRGRQPAAPARDKLLSSDTSNASSAPARSDSTQMSALIEAIENERDRLMTAESLLGCVLAAMESYDAGDVDGPYYPGVLKLAREILHESLSKLDSVRIKPLIRELAGTTA